MVRTSMHTKVVPAAATVTLDEIIDYSTFSDSMDERLITSFLGYTLKKSSIRLFIGDVFGLTRHSSAAPLKP